MDSSQVLSNLVKMNGLELVVAGLQAVHEQLPDPAKQQWAERWSIHLEGRPHQICYKIPNAEAEEHLEPIGREPSAVEAMLAEQAPDGDAPDLVTRVLGEQTERDADGSVRLRPGEDVPADSLQSPHDRDATYRFKGEVPFRGGYVITVSADSPL